MLPHSQRRQSKSHRQPQHVAGALSFTFAAPDLPGAFVTELDADSVMVSLPTSLASLHIHNDPTSRLGRLRLQHLTRLTHLDVSRLDARVTLPPSLRSLHVQQPLNLSVPENDTPDDLGVLMSRDVSGVGRRSYA